MTTDSQRCRALTKAGEPCKKMTQPGGDYCYFHRSLAQAEGERSAAPPDAHPPATPFELRAVGEPAPTDRWARRSEHDLLIHELDALVRELQRQIPGASAAARLFSRQPSLSADEQEEPSSSTLDLLVQLRDSILESTVQDLLDRETWKGFWLVTQVALQSQVDEAKARLDAQMEVVPGYRTAREVARSVRSSLGGQTPE